MMNSALANESLEEAEGVCRREVSARRREVYEAELFCCIGTQQQARRLRSDTRAEA